VGIGGCGLSGLARLLHERGASVSGSDSVRSVLTETLEAEGIPIAYEQEDRPLPPGCHLAIASAAIKPDHPELAAAHREGIPVASYAEALGMVQAEHTGISIAGTHGKSTTAGMLAHVLVEGGLDPTVIVGASCPQIGGGCRTGGTTVPGEGPYAGRPALLLAEACEFNRSFHLHRPVIGLINNIEEDHLDVYGDLEAIVEAFAGFARLIPPEPDGGRLLIAHDGAHRERVAADLACEVETFGPDPAADYQVIFDDTMGRVAVRKNGRELAAWTCPMAGRHNAHNAAAAAILASYVGVPWPAIAASLAGFQGLSRRMERLGERSVADGRVVLYDDYGHHPTEIERTLEALRAVERPRRLVCVFQPHQHSRTRFLLARFAESFAAADVVIVPHIYFVRDSEIERHRVSAADLVDRLRSQGVLAMHVYPFEAIVEQLEVICRDGDLVVVMGAGPVWKVAEAFMARQQSREMTPATTLSVADP
jgi:UDP-N-acetylmuramate--alanine ligase